MSDKVATSTINTREIHQKEIKNGFELSQIVARLDKATAASASAD